MDFRTIVRPVEGRQGLIKHGVPLILIGSCFSDNIGRCLCDELFDVDVNPFGPIYNPLSIKRGLEVLSTNEAVGQRDIIFRDGLFRSFLFHSRYSDPDEENVIKLMNSRIENGHAMLREASVVIITLGTTRAFVSRESGQVVANCHKVPASEFELYNLSLADTVKALNDIVEIIKKCSPEAHVMFTVSPLRYTELGAHGNQLSKAVLLLGVDEVVKAYEDDSVSYFPAYEIMMDDLRDYRFYADDMKHPSPMAVNYIYDLFRESFFNAETIKIARESSALTRRLSHRIMSASPESVEKEMNSREMATRRLLENYPKLTYAYRRYINTLLSNNGI